MTKYVRIPMPMDGMCFWHAGTRKDQPVPDVMRDGRNIAMDALQRDSESHAAIEYAKPWMQVMGRWNPDDPAHADFQPELENIEEASRQKKMHVRVVADQKLHQFLPPSQHHVLSRDLVNARCRHSDPYCFCF